MAIREPRSALSELRRQLWLPSSSHDVLRHESKNSALLVPPCLVQRVLQECQAARMVPMPYHIGGRGGGQVTIGQVAPYRVM